MLHSCAMWLSTMWGSLLQCVVLQPVTDALRLCSSTPDACSACLCLQTRRTTRGRLGQGSGRPAAGPTGSPADQT
jgi:hypothetical protein